MKIQGQPAIVTGGASGLGAETVRQLADAGAKVTIFDLNEAAAKELAAEVGGLGISCDITNTESVENATCS